jgi:hypothetical protein
MKKEFLFTITTVGMITISASAQSILFDFDNAPRYTSLPITLTVGGVTAQFSATGQGFSIQAADTMGFTPMGFSGNCIYPNSINAADLLVGFSAKLTAFSILYAPQELACDSSARMRVTAYFNGTMVGSNTTNAIAGTWPSETLAIASPQEFDSVVVHYDAPPPTGGDYGTIFMADNMVITPAPPPLILTNAVILANGGFQFAFTYVPDVTFNVFSATNASLPLSQWSLLGNATQLSPGQYQFTDAQAWSDAQRFYHVRSP